MVPTATTFAWLRVVAVAASPAAAGCFRRVAESRRGFQATDGTGSRFGFPGLRFGVGLAEEASRREELGVFQAAREFGGLGGGGQGVPALPWNHQPEQLAEHFCVKF